MSFSSGDCAARACGKRNTVTERYNGRAYPIAGPDRGDAFLHAFAASFPPVIKSLGPAARSPAALIFAISASPASSASVAAGPATSAECGVCNDAD